MWKIYPHWQDGGKPVIYGLPKDGGGILMNSLCDMKAEWMQMTKATFYLSEILPVNGMMLALDLKGCLWKMDLDHMSSQKDWESIRRCVHNGGYQGLTSEDGVVYVATRNWMNEWSILASTSDLTDVKMGSAMNFRSISHEKGFTFDRYGGRDRKVQSTIGWGSLKAHQGFLYAIKAEPGNKKVVYRHRISTMKRTSSWERVTSANVRRIWLQGNMLFGIESDEKVAVSQDLTFRNQWEYRTTPRIVDFFVTPFCGEKGSWHLKGNMRGEWKPLGFTGVESRCHEVSVEHSRGQEASRSRSRGFENSMSTSATVEVSFGQGLFGGSVGGSVGVARSQSRQWAQEWTTSWSRSSTITHQRCFNPSDMAAHYMWQWTVTAQQVNGEISVLKSHNMAFSTDSAMQPKCLPFCALDYSDHFSENFPNGNSGPSYQKCHSDGDLCFPCGWLDPKNC